MCHGNVFAPLADFDDEADVLDSALISGVLDENLQVPIHSFYAPNLNWHLPKLERMCWIIEFPRKPPKRIYRLYNRHCFSNYIGPLWSLDRILWQLWSRAQVMCMVIYLFGSASKQRQYWHHIAKNSLPHQAMHFWKYIAPSFVPHIAPSGNAFWCMNCLMRCK